MKRHTKSYAVIEVAILSAMEIAFKRLRNIGALFGVALVVLTAGFGAPPVNAQEPDSLYVGDQTDSPASNNTVKRFDAETGDFLGNFVTSNSGGLKGPRGLIFDHPGRLEVVNQNQGLDPLSGAVLQYDGETGAFSRAIVPATDTSSPEADPNAPFAPRGMVLRNQRVLFVAEFLGVGNTPGRLLAFTKNGKFLAELTPDPSILPPDLFHPRGVVVGPDGLLYVSNFPDLATGLGGHVLRVHPVTGDFDVFISDNGGIGLLNRPEGLVFGPDGHLYITSFRANAGDTDSIRIYDEAGVFVDKIDLDQVGQPRAFAQAILFGPGGFLFVPITGNGPDTGAVRRYDVVTKEVDNFVDPGTLGQPFYLTFGDTNPGTLAYEPPEP